MRILFLKDKNRRQIYKIYEKEKIILKYISRNFLFSKNIRYASYVKLIINYLRDSSIVRIRNRCVLTNRSRAVYRKFKMSRLMLRELALKGYLIGVKKASW